MNKLVHFESMQDCLNWALDELELSLKHDLSLMTGAEAGFYTDSERSELKDKLHDASLLDSAVCLKEQATCEGYQKEIEHVKRLNTQLVQRLNAYHKLHDLLNDCMVEGLMKAEEFDETVKQLGIIDRMYGE